MTCVFCDTPLEPGQAEYLPARRDLEPEPVCVECFTPPEPVPDTGWYDYLIDG